MADKKISELVSADALSGAELIETVQGGVNKRTTAQDIANLAPGAGHVIEDEGTPLTARTKLNFVGAGVTVTDDGGDDATVVTIDADGGTTLFAGLTDDPRDNAALEAELEALEAADDTKANLAIEIRSITGSHTLDATDATNFTSGKSMHIKGNGAGTLTIPLQATQAMPAGYNVMYSGFTAVVEGDSAIVTNPSSGLLNSASTTAKYLLIRNSADNWDVENGEAVEFVFNVENYGAVHDNSTDDTAAIQAAINACYAANGGVVYFPRGIYIIGGALITSLDGVNPNCQLYIPLHNKITDHATIPTIKFRGEIAPAPFGTMLNATGGVQPVSTGVILKSTITGSGTNPRVIGSSWYNTGFTDTNSIYAIFENIRIRVRSFNGTTDIAPTMGAFGLKYIECAECHNCIADTETNSYNSVEPTSSGVVGFDTPQLSNRANSRLYRCLAKNMYTGFVINEHLYADDLLIDACLEGYKFVSNAHPWLMGKLIANGYRYGFVFEGFPRGVIQAATCERSPGTHTRWFAGVADFYAPTPLDVKANVVMHIHVLESGANQSVQPSGSGTFNGGLRLVDLSNVRRYYDSTGLVPNGDYPVDQLRHKWTAVSNDTYAPTRTYVHKQNGTANVVGQEIWVNEQSSHADKRLGMIEVKTNGSTESSLMNIYTGNGGIVHNWELRPTRNISKVALQLPSYTVAGVPSAATSAGQMIYVSNETGGAVLAFSDGTNWRRVTDRAIIS